MHLVRIHSNSRAFAGLFVFEDDSADVNAYLSAIVSASPRWDNRLNFVSLGSSRFIRYWHESPDKQSRLFEGWIAYHLPELAPGYFIHNVVEATTPNSVLSNPEIWFPSRSKEAY